MHRAMNMAFAAGLVMTGSVTLADTVDARLAAYQAEGAGPFDAARGEAMWTREFNPVAAEPPRSCTACHTGDLTSNGKHVRTGKPIKPLAPSVNAQRLTDAAEIEKWFTRNCKWTVGRECTAQEKGDFLSYLRLQ